MSEARTIYFLRPVGQIGPIKIGCSKLPEQRLETMARWSPNLLEVICTAPGTMAKEAELHGLFRAHHLHHEWFGASKELLALIDTVKATRQIPDLPKVIPFHLKAKPRSPCKGRPAPMRAGHLTREKIANAYAPDRTAAEIADEVGRGRPYVATILRELGLKPKREACPQIAAGPADMERAAEFRRRYEAGETLQQIATDWGVTRERVRQVLRKTNVPSLGHRPEHRVQPAPITDFEREVAADYLRIPFGGSAGKFAEGKGVTISQLNNILRRTGTKHLGTSHFLSLPDDARITREVCELYTAGVGAAEIVSRVPELKFPETVYRYLAKGGVKARGKGKTPLTEMQTARCIRLFKSGATMKEVVAEIGRGPSCIRSAVEPTGHLPSREEFERRRTLRVSAANARRKDAA